MVIDLGDNRFSVINRANAAIRDYILKNQYDIGESILITDFYKVLQKVKGVIDVVDLEIVQRAGGTYSSLAYDFENKLTADGRRIEGESNVIFELKFPNIDITGAIQ